MPREVYELNKLIGWIWRICLRNVKRKKEKWLIGHHIRQTFSARFKKGEIFILLDHETKVNTSVVQLEAANFAADEFMQETYPIYRGSLLPEESRL